MPFFFSLVQSLVSYYQQCLSIFLLYFERTIRMNAQRLWYERKKVRIEVETVTGKFIFSVNSV